MSIPTPRGLPILGNVLSIDPELPSQSFVDLIRKHGEIVNLDIVGRSVTVVGSQRLVHELCDQKRFQKRVDGALGQVRALAGDGLFTAHQHEESWAIAHRILIPTFGPLAIKGMFPGMQDIAGQLLQKWARFGDHRIDVPAEFTRLTLDTIALCTFSHRFNSFYSEQDPPMVGAMVRTLIAAGAKIRRVPGTAWLYQRSDAATKEDIALQHKIADDLVRERIDSGESKGDLLDAMLTGKDPVTGKGLDPVNIRYQLVTFLIAGHETTSGLLSFLFYYLLKDPSKVAKIREEVDRICGAEPITFAQLSKLEYIDAALKETLRLKPTAPAFTVEPIAEEETLPGGYKVKRGYPILIALEALHTDPSVWGEDAYAFRPERMLDGGFANMPPDAWKPFGNGVRACIGRPFAWQEALLVVAAIFQNFDVRPDDASYELAIKSSLTIKPKGFFMRAKLRKDRDLARSLGAAPVETKNEVEKPLPTVSKGPKLLILYGSNSGTCKALAEQLAGSAGSSGFSVRIGHLDEYASRLPTEGAIAIVTASYEGQPTDDARFFHQYLQDAKETQGVKYAVFGCGHPDWVATYHAIPTYIDHRLSELGAERLIEIGKGNSSSADLFDHFHDWESSLLAALGGTTSKASIDVAVHRDTRAKLLQYALATGKCVSNTLITQHGAAKRHIVFELPEEAAYRAGDYLELLPFAPPEYVRRALARFGMHPDDVIKLSNSGAKVSLPLDTPLSVSDVLHGFVELGSVVSTRTVQRLVDLTPDEKDRQALQKLQAEDISKQHLSLLDLLERFPSIDMSFGDFLLALPPLRIRQYSISSSPLDNPRLATLTVAIVEAPHVSGSGTTYYGTSTSYLASLIPGSTVHVGVRPSSNFHLPPDPATPLIMAAAGSGIAPFRAFIQERALQKAAGREVGPALLFFGCPNHDGALYDDEMTKWQADGVVSVRYAFSKTPEQSEGCKHVQDRIYHDRQDIDDMFQNARLYFCGAKKVAIGVEEVMRKMYRERTGNGEDEAMEWYKQIQADRFATDVFG